MPAVELKYTPYRLVPLSRIILCKLYFAHVNDDSREQFSVEDIRQMFSVPVSANMVRSAADYLRGEPYRETNYVTRHTPKAGTKQYSYKITERGIMHVEQEFRRRDSDLSYFRQHGDDALDDVAGIDSIFMTDEERAIADPWIPLPIDREETSYAETVQELETAIEAIRGDNGYAAKEPAERNAILETLDAGLAWLKEKLPTRSQIMSLLIKPLSWVAARFPESVMGEASKRAAQKLLDYLSNLFL